MRNPLKVRHKEYGYGFFPGGDPRLFRPDEEGTTAEEHANHLAACEAWDRGECTSAPDGTWVGNVHLLRCQFGLGSYEWTDELWVWEYVRWIWWDGFTKRLWWRWHLDVRNWAKARGLLRWRLVRRAFDEDEQ